MAAVPCQHSSAVTDALCGPSEALGLSTPGTCTHRAPVAAVALVRSTLERLATPSTAPERGASVTRRGGRRVLRTEGAVAVRQRRQGSQVRRRRPAVATLQLLEEPAVLLAVPLTDDLAKGE